MTSSALFLLPAVSARTTALFLVVVALLPTVSPFILQTPSFQQQQQLKAASLPVSAPLGSRRRLPWSTSAALAYHQRQQQHTYYSRIISFHAASVDDADEEDEEIEFDDEYNEDGDEVEGEEDSDEEDEDFEGFVDDEDDDGEEDVEAVEDEEDAIMDGSDLLVSKTLGGKVIDEGIDELAEEDEGYDDEEEEEEENVNDITLASSDEWDEDDDMDYPLEDDPDDPNYQKQNELLDNAVIESDNLDRDRFFNPTDFLMSQINPEVLEKLDSMPFIQQARTRAEQLQLTEEDVADLDIEKEMKNVPDLLNDDPYSRHDPDEINFLEANVDISDDDMESLDASWKMSQAAQAATPWDQVMVREQQGFDGLSNETLIEIDACLRQIGGSAYNCTRWLLYDLDFNVENLMLSAVKVNREAPILFQHWYPQLVTYSRYAGAQARNFDYTWEDVENADISELERYYKGIGYDEIPNKAPAETGIVEFDYLDEEEIKMAAFETWVKDVYNPEWDRKDFDDDDFRDEDNVFSKFYEDPQHPDLPSFEDSQEDIEAWRQTIGTDEELIGNKEGKAYRDYMAREFDYDVVQDKEFEEEFRGHLVVACTGDDADLEIAEKITAAMEEAFGKQIYVETQLIAHAREEDNVFEVWLESYEIELLHSKKRASSNAKGWDGPADCDDNQIDHLVERVRFLVSDDARYSYSLEYDDAAL